MIFLLIYVINISAQTISQLQFSLYPTEEELYQNYLEGFLPSSQLMCKIDHQVPNVQIINQSEEISITKGDQFISMSSNNTHFFTLSNKNTGRMYEWKNQNIQQVGSNVTINSSFNCFNINLSQYFSILIDCYSNNEFLLIQLIDKQQQIAYQKQSSIPTSTKIQTIYMPNILRNIQYFRYSQLFQNLGSLNQYQFADFDIPITISPNIYAITNQEIFQLSISSDSTFNNKYRFTSTGMNNFTIINAFYNFLSYSQCDQIKLLYIQKYSNLSDYKIAQFLGCEGQIIKVMDFCPVNSCQSIQKILQNTQFMIYISTNVRVIMQKSEGDRFFFYHINQNNSLFYFNDDNELQVKKNYQFYFNLIRIFLFIKFHYHLST
ncbi:unnamed protein product [Paramecium sonneborni]|uniref:Uncharacterized protein n=1 Tax=Paramecium sonneborni TaxID=65129 RepID=A0A8S1RQE5_9CILI|nr:unnamed protein product [Paramecium sonneborni]